MVLRVSQSRRVKGGCAQELVGGEGGWGGGLAPPGMRLPPGVAPLVVTCTGSRCRPARRGGCQEGPWQTPPSVEVCAGLPHCPTQRGIRMGHVCPSPFSPPLKPPLAEGKFESNILRKHNPFAPWYGLMSNHYLGHRWMDKKPYTIVSGVVMTLITQQRVFEERDPEFEDCGAL